MWLGKLKFVWGGVENIVRKEENAGFAAKLSYPWGVAVLEKIWKIWWNFMHSRLFFFAQRIILYKAHFRPTTTQKFQIVFFPWKTARIIGLNFQFYDKCCLVNDTLVFVMIKAHKPMYYRSVLTLGQWENNRGWVCLATPAHAITTFNQHKTLHANFVWI